MVRWQVHRRAPEKVFMTQTFDVYARHNLRPVRLLQETDTHRVELVQDAEGQRQVLKTYRVPSRFLEIEQAFLRTCGDLSFEFLRIPKLIAAGHDYLVMSFVDRTHHTRDTIALHDWTDDDVALFGSGLCEFQQLTIERRLFTIKQRVMGFLYPVIRLALTFRAGLRARALRLSDLPRLACLALCYLVSRLTFRNVLTHYDLTTLNYAFAPGQRMSMLDFEFAYSSGDPMFDAIYYVTIPPVAVSAWTFQRSIVARCVDQAGSGFLAWNRAHLILIVCLLSRCLHFADCPREQAVVRGNVRTFLSWRSFAEYKTQIEGLRFGEATPDALVA